MAIPKTLLLPAILALVIPACRGEDHPAPRVIEATTVRFEIPQALGTPQRPLVEFDHATHARALMKEGCGACHKTDDQGRVFPWLKGHKQVTDLDDLMESTHQICVSCHQERFNGKQKSGPVECGECHRELPPPVSSRREIRWDYSMHFRHVAAVGDDCGTCHHLYDQKAKKLVQRKGTESSCSDCHAGRAIPAGTVNGTEDKPLSLRDASHLACINCHMAYDKKSKRTGPVLCAGCHDPKSQEKFKRLDDLPRLERGQPDLTWIHTKEAKSNLVAFDHKNHESQARSCSTCHHKTLLPCGDCHTLTGSEKGGGVTLEQAYHSDSSEASCVGCHQARLQAPACQSCHHMLPASATGQTCKVCHSGPLPRNAEDPPTAAPVELAALPVPSADFPDIVVIDALAAQFAPSRLPHREIVARLDSMVRNNKLAGRFHGQTATLCAGCHHNSPVGMRPAACKSCHTVEADPRKDKPGLLAAYHRQCIGCHQQLELVQGCTDCHAKTSGGTKP